MTSYARRMDGSTMLSLYYLTYIYYPTLIIAAEVGHRAVSFSHLCLYQHSTFRHCLRHRAQSIFWPERQSSGAPLPKPGIQRLYIHYGYGRHNYTSHRIYLVGNSSPPGTAELPSSDRHENIQQILNRHNNCVLYFLRLTSVIICTPLYSN